MTPEQYQQTQRAKVASLKKAKSRPVLERIYAARQTMSETTAYAIARRHKQAVATVSKLRHGKPADYVPVEIRRKIHLDFMRHDDAANDYKSLDQVAIEFEVARSTVRKWVADFGLSETTQKRKPKAASKPVELLWPGTPVGRFAVMRLSRNPDCRACYY